MLSSLEKIEQIRFLNYFTNYDSPKLSFIDQFISMDGGNVQVDSQDYKMRLMMRWFVLYISCIYFTNISWRLNPF